MAVQEGTAAETIAPEQLDARTADGGSYLVLDTADAAVPAIFGIRDQQRLALVLLEARLGDRAARWRAAAADYKEQHFPPQPPQ